MEQNTPQNDTRPGWLTRLAERIDDWLFAAEDARAKSRDWQVTRRGLGRVYRDPRWDSVHACEVCDGVGGDCVVCGGTGVVRDLAEASDLPRRCPAELERVRWEVRP